MFIFQIEEKIPVEVCKNIRKNNAGITINRGQAVRKEGEKRRTEVSKDNGKYTIYDILWQIGHTNITEGRVQKKGKK